MSLLVALEWPEWRWRSAMNDMITDYSRKLRQEERAFPIEIRDAND
jgi:hypothetical protein